MLRLGSLAWGHFYDDFLILCLPSVDCDRDITIVIPVTEYNAMKDGLNMNISVTLLSTRPSSSHTRHTDLLKIRHHKIYTCKDVILGCNMFICCALDLCIWRFDALPTFISGIAAAVQLGTSKIGVLKINKYLLNGSKYHIMPWKRWRSHR